MKRSEVWNWRNPQYMFNTYHGKNKCQGKKQNISIFVNVFCSCSVKKSISVSLPIICVCLCVCVCVSVFFSVLLMFFRLWLMFSALGLWGGGNDGAHGAVENPRPCLSFCRLTQRHRQEHVNLDKGWM